MVYICKLFTTTEADFVSYAGKFTKSAEIWNFSHAQQTMCIHSSSTMDSALALL